MSDEKVRIGRVALEEVVSLTEYIQDQLNVISQMCRVECETTIEYTIQDGIKGILPITMNMIEDVRLKLLMALKEEGGAK